MPRPREFEPDIVLDRAVRLFWRQGYHHTSMQELEDTMGINRFSIYATFENKHALFLAALERYRQTVVTHLIADMQEPDASLESIRRFFTRFVDLSQGENGDWGCLVANSATEMARYDCDVVQEVVSYKEQVQSAFRHALTNAKQAGDLDKGEDVEALVVYLMGAVFGVMVYSKTSVPVEELAQYVESVLQRL